MPSTVVQETHLLALDEPSPIEIFNPSGHNPVVITCDHASYHVPRALEDLKLADTELQRHIGWDCGAAELTRSLAKRLDAFAVLSRYSRLVIDCNRNPGSKSSIPEVSDGTIVPGNIGLTAQQRQQRIDTLFQPYHGAIRKQLETIQSGGKNPVYISMHTFTQCMAGVERPWHISILWDCDPRIAQPLLQALRSQKDLVVGENEPYSARTHFDYSNYHHAESAGLANALIEIREDQLRDHSGVSKWGEILGEALEAILENPELYRDNN